MIWDPDTRPKAELEYEDWTRGESGASNSSEEFLKLCAAVEGIIRRSAHFLIAGRSDTVARTIVAQLAHVHGLVPKPPIERSE